MAKNKGVREVVVALSEAGEVARGEVMLRFRVLGGDLDRWQGRDREAMREAITRTEDWLELEHPAMRCRDGLRAVRRTLE
jgi:hypothetical protein